MAGEHDDNGSLFARSADLVVLLELPTYFIGGVHVSGWYWCRHISH